MFKAYMFMIIVSFMVIFTGNAFSATLVWKAPDTGTVDEYRIYFGTDTNNMALVNTVESSVFAFSLDSVFMETGTQYFFGVKAYNSAGESDISNIVSYTPGDVTPPMPPTGITAQ